MTTHKLVPTAAAVAAALLTATAAQAHGAASTLKLNVTGTKISEVDVPPLVTSKTSPETPGDEVIAVSRVSGAASGHRYLTCSATKTAPSVETALYACQVTYVLARGTITASGVVRLSGRATAAITGGTGAYAGAHGVLTSVSGKDTLAFR
jgi:hypothetical protein